MTIKKYKPHEQNITTNPVQVIARIPGFLDCSVGVYNYSCCYDIAADTYSMLADGNGEFRFFNNSLSKKLFNLLRSRVRHG